MGFLKSVKKLFKTTSPDFMQEGFHEGHTGHEGFDVGRTNMGVEHQPAASTSNSLSGNRGCEDVRMFGESQGSDLSPRAGGSFKYVAPGSPSLPEANSSRLPPLQVGRQSGRGLPEVAKGTHLARQNDDPTRGKSYAKSPHSHSSEQRKQNPTSQSSLTDASATVGYGSLSNSHCTASSHGHGNQGTSYGEMSPPYGMASAASAGASMHRNLHSDDLSMHTARNLLSSPLPADIPMRAVRLNSLRHARSCSESAFSSSTLPLQPTESLKNILGLGQYNFVSDTDVTIAKMMVDSDVDDDDVGTEDESGLLGLPLAVPSIVSDEHAQERSSSPGQPGNFFRLAEIHPSHTPVSEGAGEMWDSVYTGVGTGPNSPASSPMSASPMRSRKHRHSITSCPGIMTKPRKSSNVLAVSEALPPAMRRSMWSLADYQLTKQLHKGYASDVFQARCKRSQETVVLKVYRLADQCDLQRVQLHREISLHSRLHHVNIIQFFAAFLEDNCVIIVQEYARGGDLLRILHRSGGRLMEGQAVRLVLQPVLAAMQYLHSLGIVHRDIKPENVLFMEDSTLKLGDFGLAIDLNAERPNTRAGTLDYMAPEVLRCPTKKTPDENKLNPDGAVYNLAADTWAVGVFAYEIVVGCTPFRAEEMIDTARLIIHSQPVYPNSLSEAAKDFITRSLAKHSGDRPTVMQMLAHPWINASSRMPLTLGALRAAHQQVQQQPVPQSPGKPQPPARIPASPTMSSNLSLRSPFQMQLQQPMQQQQQVAAGSPLRSSLTLQPHPPAMSSRSMMHSPGAPHSPGIAHRQSYTSGGSPASPSRSAIAGTNHVPSPRRSGVPSAPLSGVSAMSTTSTGLHSGGLVSGALMVDGFRSGPLAEHRESRLSDQRPRGQRFARASFQVAKAEGGGSVPCSPMS